MPDQPEGPGVDTEPPGAPPKKTGGGRVAQPPPASDSEKDSGLSGRGCVLSPSPGLGGLCPWGRPGLEVPVPWVGGLLSLGTPRAGGSLSPGLGFPVPGLGVPGARWGLTPTLADASSEDLSGREQTDTEEPPSTGTQLAPLRHPLTTLTPGHPFACLAPICLVHSLFLQQVMALCCRIRHRAPLAPRGSSTMLCRHWVGSAPRASGTGPLRHHATLALCGSGTVLLRHWAGSAPRNFGTGAALALGCSGTGLSQHHAAPVPPRAHTAPAPASLPAPSSLQPLALPPPPWQPAQLLLLQPLPPAAPRHEATAACHEATASVGSPGSRNRHLGATAELLRQQGLLAAALRTGTLLRQNRRTQREIVALRRQSRLLARVARDPRAWPRLCHALGGGDPLGPPTPCREPPAFGEGVGVGVRGEKGVPNASPPCVLPLRPWGPPGTGALNSTERRGGSPPGFADIELKEHLVRS